MKRIAALALGGLLAAPAFAGGPITVAPEPIVEPMPAPVVVAPVTDWSGFYVGGQLGYGDVGTEISGLDGNGAIGGVHAGYRYDFGRAVVGAEIAYDMTNIDIGDSAELDNVATLKLMAGGKIGRGLLYATAGGTWADVTSDAGDPDDGYVYGIGYDYMLNDRWSVGAELLRHEWDTFDDAGTDADATTLQAKVGFRF
ncbi:porin family protein [Cereibacter azotoformans]|uniref:Opacity protein-like surface antigen n=2 Tax=Cereibacter TaxID=1653176 RepID=A0A2T5KCH5_9RHOB|nr:porin family protein [Cereibacter azotoformans]AXQ95121.1 porin family protein [Cereibacter sphaeroides]MBO4168176.1 porin family protein [Cereibacter azotoformans]PTR20113.1 opacity protein-like surface antigen [Cereibacter azotoformans]UIJ29555.1 porin family protein [Cereibacter azotoformans]ULB10240.1 porin family protein [Cereibacter azotoformans]